MDSLKQSHVPYLGLKGKCILIVLCLKSKPKILTTQANLSYKQRPSSAQTTKDPRIVLNSPCRLCSGLAFSATVVCRRLGSEMGSLAFPENILFSQLAHMRLKVNPALSAQFSLCLSYFPHLDQTVFCVLMNFNTLITVSPDRPSVWNP